MIQYLIFGILFFKILFLYLSRRSSRYHQSFFYFRFSSRKSQIEQKLAKKITHFTIQFCSKNLTHFTNLNSLDTENNMLPQHSQKPFWLYKFSANMFLFGVRNNICTAPFLDTQELHSWSTLKANVCIKCLNNFANVARCFDLVKCLSILHFNWNFWKLSFFPVFRYLHLL